MAHLREGEAADRRSLLPQEQQKQEILVIDVDADDDDDLYENNHKNNNNGSNNNDNKILFIDEEEEEVSVGEEELIARKEILFQVFQFVKSYKHRCEPPSLDPLSLQQWYKITVTTKPFLMYYPQWTSQEKEDMWYSKKENENGIGCIQFVQELAGGGHGSHEDDWVVPFGTMTNYYAYFKTLQQTIQDNFPTLEIQPFVDQMNERLHTTSCKIVMVVDKQ
jgi:hypothetical protein